MKKILKNILWITLWLLVSSVLAIIIPATIQGEFGSETPHNAYETISTVRMILIVFISGLIAKYASFRLNKILIFFLLMPLPYLVNLMVIMRYTNLHGYVAPLAPMLVYLWPYTVIFPIAIATIIKAIEKAQRNAALRANQSD